MGYKSFGKCENPLPAIFPVDCLLNSVTGAVLAFGKVFFHTFFDCFFRFSDRVNLAFSRPNSSRL